VQGFTRRQSLIAAAGSAGAAFLVPAVKAAQTAPVSQDVQHVSYRTQKVGDVEIFYREAGRPDAPVLLLLHGYPTSSHMFRGLMPLLADRFRVIAPDLPGFGLTKAPPRGQFTYSFDNLAKVVDQFTQALGLSKYALYVFDYGAPTGFRLAAAHPERVTAIVSQNGNAYKEGLSTAWSPYQTYWENPTDANRAACRAALTPEAIHEQYVHGADASRVSPDGYMLDAAYIARAGADEIQLDLIYDYRTNVALYPAWQAYFRAYRPPLLAVWGDKDPYFLPPGARAFARDIPGAEIHFFDSGHFALETHGPEIADRIRDFLGRHLGA
jgi:pimeloyl-ACP methyl ester carboxylesterase